MIRAVARRWASLAVCGACLVAALWLIAAGVAWSRAELLAPEPSLLIRDRQGRFLGATGGDDDSGFGYWQVADLPQRVVAATLAVEDRRFWRHGGVDARAVLRASGQNLASGRRVSGASTLAMQVARMQRPGARSYPRKLVEAMTGMLLTSRYGRDAVLRHYLRIVPYGNQVHGIAYAARRYLDKPVADLSWAEVAFLAAIPQSPSRMNPLTPAGRQRAVERGGRILDLLRSDGVMSATEHAQAMLETSSLEVPPAAARPDAALHAVLAIEQLFRAPEHRQALAGQPLVRATIDLAVQEEVSWMALDALRGWYCRGAGNAAAIVVHRGSREILAWVGSTDYFDERHAGAIDYTRVARSPGSTLKPFIYAQAFERGLISPASILDDLERGAGGIGNSDERFLGPLLPRTALANSRNVPAANLLDRLGLEEGYAFLGELGLHDGSEPAARYGLGLAIGGMPVRLEQLVRAYAAIAGDGLLGELVWYAGQPTPPLRRLISEDTARRITRHLADPMARLPTFPRMGHLEFPFPVAVKTGTSSGYHDSWTVAWSERYLVGVWVGHPDHRPMTRLSGYGAAAQLVARILRWLHEDRTDGLREVGFPAPRGSHGVRLCALTGLLATAACERVVIEHFRAAEEPVQRCEVHQRRAVDTRNGLLATAATARQWVELRTFTELAPRYARWQSGAGLPRLPGAVSGLGAGRGGAMTAHVMAARGMAPAISITAPAPDLSLLRDPETPAELATMALQAVVDPPSEQVVWYVDGEPFRVADYPYTTRWPLSPGSHSFQARVPFTSARSRVVRVRVF